MTETCNGGEVSPVVLLVEDEVLIRLADGELLREKGYTVLEAASATEAMVLFSSDHPLDAIVTDVRMPGELDGLMLTRIIKEARPSLPVILVSGHYNPAEGHLADRFLRKPYPPEVLIDTLEELIGPRWESRASNKASS